MAVGIIAASNTLAAKAMEGVGKIGVEGIAGKEVKLSELSDVIKKREALEPIVGKAKSDSLESLVLENKEKAAEINEKVDRNVNEVRETREGLSDEEKQKIKEETGWSDEIIDNIRSLDEYEIYRKAELQEVEIGGRKALVRNDIDWEQVDEKGRTNSERVEKGLAPLDKEGNSIELHHIGQHTDSPLAELTFKEHRCDGNDTILHDKTKETETHGEGSSWDNERQDYWKNKIDFNERGEN